MINETGNWEYPFNFKLSAVIPTINIERKGMEKMKEPINVGRGTPEFTPVEIGSIPERANPVVETGSPLRQLGEDVTMDENIFVPALLREMK